MNRARTNNAYVPPFELTEGQGAPIAAHFVINFMNLDYITRVELPAES